MAPRLGVCAFLLLSVFLSFAASAQENEPLVLKITTRQDVVLYAVNEPVIVTLFDASGREVWSGTVHSPYGHRIALPAGTYTAVQTEGILFGGGDAPPLEKNKAFEAAGTAPAGGYPHPSPDGKVHVLCPPRPFYQNVYDPHFTYSGHVMTLKAVIWPVEGVTYQYTWAFGDGTAPETGTLLPGFDQYAVETTHVFPLGAEYGDLFSATLTLEGNDGDGPGTNPDAVGRFNVIVEPEENIPDVRRSIAIEDGLWYLHKSMTDRVDLGFGEPVPVGVFGANMGVHCQCIEAFELSGFLTSNDGDRDPYVETLERAFNFLLSEFTIEDITSEPQADTNGNGIGLYTRVDYRQVYESGIALIALATAQTPHKVVGTVIDPVDPAAAYVNGRTYAQVIQDFADFMYYAQVDDGSFYNGGWRYVANDTTADWSVSQWPVLGIFLAQYRSRVDSPAWNFDVPGFVMQEIKGWIANCQNPAGYFGYLDSSVGNRGLTGGGLIALDWLLYNGEIDVGGVGVTQRIKRAREWIGKNWGVQKYYNMYAVMKGATLHGVGDDAIAEIDDFEGHTWHYDPAVPDDGYWPWLVDRQEADGKWPEVQYGSAYKPINTAWAICILAGFPGGPPPVARLLANYSDDITYVDIGWAVLFDGTESYDLNVPPLPIVSYTFDFGDGSPIYREDATSAPDGLFDGKTTHAYAAYSSAAPDYRPGYMAELVVTNEAKKASFPDVVEVVVRPPNHPPTPVWHWTPEPALAEQIITFDATASFDVNEPDGDYIVSYEWDFDNDGLFDEAAGPVVTWSWPVAGSYPVGIRVTDRDDLWSNSPWPVEDYKLLHLGASNGSRIEVEKWVGGSSQGAWQKSLAVFPGTWVYYRVVISNLSASQPVEHCYVKDQVDGPFVAWELVEGPAGFEPNTPEPIDIGAIPAGSSGLMEIVYRVRTDPEFDETGTTQDLNNTVFVESDGPDDDILPDANDGASDSDGPLHVNIVVGGISVTQEARVLDSQGGEYGYAPSITLQSNVPFPLHVTWRTVYRNESDAPVAPDVTGRGYLLEKLPLLGNPPTGDGLPPWSFPALAPGAAEERVVHQLVLERNEWEVLDRADNGPGKSDHIVESRVFSDDIEGYTASGVVGVLNLGAQEGASVIELRQDTAPIPALSWPAALALIVLLGLLIAWRAGKG